jgi:DNA (cytosine-5)-methyltransferase 3A
METEKGINVLSLFDGISVGQLALKELNIPVKNYYASEIDKNAIKVTKHHFPETIQLGDITKIDATALPKIDLLIFGSPCQDLSSLRKDRKGLDGDKSSLFFHALRLLEETSPKFYLFENVGSMSKRDRNRFDELLDVKGLMINSNLVSGANRSRIYWTNIPNITLPKDRNILLKDIIENGFTDRDKANCVLTKGVPLTVNGVNRYLKKSLGNIIYNTELFAGYNKDLKLFFLEDYSDSEVVRNFRKPTVTELERLQTLPDGYVGEVLKKTPSHHAIGNAFSLEVIKHILKFAEL